jgi:hypothetical protein
MAAPGVFSRVTCQPSADRIQVDIPHKFEEISVCIDQNRLEPSLEKMP